MNVREFAHRLDARLLTGDSGADRDVTGIYACDLLSWVMSHASKGNAWITVHTHMNIVAVALLAEISCIVLPENIPVEEATLKKAVEEGIPVLSTSSDCFRICGMAHEWSDF